METEDLYKVLQVDSGAEPEVIAAAYHRLAQKYHPDIDSTVGATIRMQQINRAYQVLSNAERRNRYDSARASEAIFGSDGRRQVMRRRPSPLMDRTSPSGAAVSKSHARFTLLVGLLLVGAVIAGWTTYSLLKPAVAAVPEPVKTVWKGQWTSEDGDVYAYKIRLRTNAKHVVSGSVRWTLIQSPTGSNQRRVGGIATSSIKGTFDPGSQVIEVGRYKHDDPHKILEVTEYRFSLMRDAQTMRGDLYRDGVWQGFLVARRTK